MTDQPERYDKAMLLTQRIAAYLDSADASYADKLEGIAARIRKEMAPMEKDHAAMEAMRIAECASLLKTPTSAWMVVIGPINGKYPNIHGDDPADAILVAVQHKPKEKSQ